MSTIYAKQKAGLWPILICLLYVNPCLLAQHAFSICPPGSSGFTECEFANCYFCNLNGYIGSTANFGPDPDGDLPGNFCAGVENVQYLLFKPSTPTLTITVTPFTSTNGDGVDIGVLHVCDLYPLEACSPGIPHGGNTPTTVLLNNLIVGSLYILIVDGNNGDICDFVITTSPSTGTVAPDYLIPSPLTIQGDFTICPNTSGVYEVTPDNYPANFTWTASPGILINGQVPPLTIFGPEGSSVNVDWGATGGQICVQPFNDCMMGTKICHNSTLIHIPPTILPPVTICFDEVPYIQPWGTAIFFSGTYTEHLVTAMGCDSAVTQTVTVIPEKVRTLPPISLCPGNCVSICGMDYCDPGTFQAHCPSVTGCDSTVNFTILNPTWAAEIAKSGILTCDHPTVTLTSIPTNGNKIWINNLGQTIGTGDSVVIGTPGAYILSVTASLGGVICTKTDTVVIQSDTTRPQITAIGGMADCDTIPLLLQANTPVNPATFAWSGPNGFTSSAQNPPVSIPGLYTVTITNPANGCTNVDTALVTICCHTFAGTLDTAAVHICGEKTISIVYHNDEVLEPDDGLVFILYADPADPAGSILEYTGAPAFPFVPGLIQWSVPYFVAVAAGHLLANDSLDLSDPCFSFSPGPEVEWLPKPVISVQPVPPEMCKGDCVDVTFNFSGTPPFQFHYDITQNGKLVYSRDESSDALQKTVSICPGAFNPPGGAGALNFTVNYFRDLHCTCTD